MSEMYSIEMIAKKFNVSTRTVVRLIEKQELRAIRVGRQWRIQKEWLEEWMTENTSQTKKEVG